MNRRPGASALGCDRKHQKWRALRILERDKAVSWARECTKVPPIALAPKAADEAWLRRQFEGLGKEDTQ